MLPCAFGLSSGYVRVLLFHDVIFSRSPHSHIVAFFCSVPCFSQLCPIIVRSILGLSVESLVTYWELAMSVCGRNVLCESDSLLNHVAKIQHPPKPIIRFYTFLAIRGHFYYEMFACPWITLFHKAETCLYGFDTKEMEIRRLHILSKILMSDWA